jgi:signal transduction histidine kinase
MPDSGARESLDRARLAIARFRVEGDDGCDRAMRYVTRAAAEKLGCARVGVWFFEDDARTAIASPLVYDARAGRYFEDEQILTEAEFPAYFAALRGNRVIAAVDATSDPATRELSTPYLTPRGIRALLDVPVYRGGEIVGILCHEDLRARRWDDDECAFATSVADMLAVALEGARRVALERELRIADRQLAVARRAEAISRVAGALGHDLNNMLSAILTAAHSLPEANDGARKVIIDAAEHGGALARELLDLARGHEGPAPTPAEGANALERMRPLLMELASPHPLEWDVSLGACELAANAGELERVAMSFVQNAKEASSGDTPIALMARVVDGHFELTVRDEGTGMTPEVMERAFDPFFTTKPHGTGLGLAMVRAIAMRRAGTVHFDTAVGQGTTITLRLPMAQPRRPG